MKTGKKLFGILLLSLLAICLTGCNDDNNLPDTPEINDTYKNPTVPQGQITVISHSIRSQLYLGAGYDIMGDYLSNRSVKGLVLDLNKIPEDNIEAHRLLSSYSKDYEGHNAKEFLQSILSKNDFSVPKENTGDLLFTGTIKNIEGFTDPYEYSTQYTFICDQHDATDVRQRIFFMNSAKLIPYLTDDFKQDSENFTPEQLIEKYGTHVMTTVYLGYRIRTIYRSVVADEGVSAFSAAYDGLGSRQETIYKIPEIEIKYPESEVLKNNGGKIIVEFNGGDENELPPITLTPNQVIGEPMNIKKWATSMNDSNYALATLSGDDLIPIYELITDVTKKQQLKEAVNAYIKANQLTTLQTAPLFQAWNGKQYRYFTSYKDLINNVNKTYACKGVIGSVFVQQQQGTIPLYSYTNEQNDRLSTENLSDMKDTESMKYKGIIGYVYEEYNNNLDTVYEIWNGKSYAYTTENKESYGEKGSWKQTGKKFYTRKISL